MFTGIIEGVGRVKSIEKIGSSGRISVEAPFDLAALNIGDSVAVEGACLTATGVSESGFIAEISPESLSLTTLGSLKTGSTVNLERALTLGTPLGGHLVTGHIDGLGTLVRKTTSGTGIVVEFSLPGELLSQLVKKGSISVDGVSLTIAQVTVSGFTVAVIPHTLESTTLKDKAEGSSVNIETDIIGKYVQRFMGAYQGEGISMDLLGKHGFLGGSDER